MKISKQRRLDLFAVYEKNWHKLNFIDKHVRDVKKILRQTVVFFMLFSRNRSQLSRDHK